MKLIVKYFGKPIKELTLEEGREYIIGRSKDCEISLLEDKSLSRRQARVYRLDSSEHWSIESLSDKGDLYLEGEKISSYEITQNYCFNLKNYSLDFVFPEPSLAESKQLKPDLGEKTKDLTKESSVISSDEETRLVSSPHLLYSFHISIEGEFSDYINLNVGEKWVIGRSPECDICIDYALLTRRHIEVVKKSHLFYVKDLGSSNKTYLNGEAIPPHKEILLRVNDKIHIEDLKILFEVRNTEYENMMNKLPVLKESKESNPQALMPTPKLVLEELTSSGIEESSSLKKVYKYQKPLFLVAGVLILTGAVFAYQYYEDKKQKAVVVNKESDKSAKIEEWNLLYESIEKQLMEKNFFDCVNEIEYLHSKVSEGHYKDSQRILNECQQGLDLQRKALAQEAREQEQLKTEKKINAIASHCLNEYNQGNIQTIQQLNECSKELVDLDPSNAMISRIKTFIEEKEMQEKMAEEEKIKQKQLIQSKKSLYYKAKKLGDQGKALKAVKAYDRFLKSSRGISSLKSLHRQAKSERNFIQNKYDSQLETLLNQCFSLMEQESFKEAYASCKKVLDFKPYEERALRSIQSAKSSLRSEIKPLYEKSQWHESFSRIEEAKKIWAQILETDIKDGYYYKKAQVQIKKYE